MSDSVSHATLIAAPPATVWSALTDARAFGTWFRVALDGPFRVGERTAGRITWPGYEGAPFLARVEVMEPPSRFVFLWPHGQADQPGVPWTKVAFTLTPEGHGTRLSVTESGFDALPEDRRDAARSGNDEGWRLQMENIRDFVESGEGR